MVEEKLTLKERVSRLLSVKTLVTLALTGTFVFLSATQVIESEQFMTIFTVVISFYFGTQATKE
jgi:hypothetical protein